MPRQYAVGDWVKVKHYAGGGQHVQEHINTSGLGKVANTHRGGDELSIDLYNPYGAVIYKSYYIVNTDTSVEPWPGGTPTFNEAGLLADIPNTAEVQALKDLVYKTTLEYARRNGYETSVLQGLKELGIVKPGSATIEATVTFTVSASVDDVISGATANNFAASFDRRSKVRQAGDLVGHARAADVSVTYEVKPYQPVIVPSPSAATTPAK